MIEEKVQVIGDKAFPLAGILSLPNGTDGKFPAVVLVHGSGPSDKDETIGKTKLFSDLAKGLAEAGITSLRYDKRTFVYGQEMLENKALSVREETIEDAIAAEKLLKEDPRVDSDKIFLIGHSMVAMLAPRIDDEAREAGINFAGLILMSGSPRRLEEIIIAQNEAMLEELDEATKAQAEPQIAALKVAFEQVYQMSDEIAQETQILPNISAYYFKEWGEKPASQYLVNLKKAIFILQGEKDFQVDLQKDFAQYQELLQAHPLAQFKTYENLNHLLMSWQGKKLQDGLAEYEIENHLSSEVLEDLVTFIKQN